MKKLEYYLELFQMFIKKIPFLIMFFFFLTDTVRLQYKNSMIKSLGIEKYQM